VTSRSLWFVACLALATTVREQPTVQDAGWPVNGGVDNIRYSPLTQINRDNVSNLKVAWTYDSHDAFKGSEMQSNPIVVDGVLYASTPRLRIIALDAATGRELWSFDPTLGKPSTQRFRSSAATLYRPPPPKASR